MPAMPRCRCLPTSGRPVARDQALAGGPSLSGGGGLKGPPRSTGSCAPRSRLVSARWHGGFGAATVALGLTAFGLATLVGCSDLSEYRGDFRGTVVGTDDDACGDGRAPCSFIRRGFAAGTELDLTFDPALARSAEPGRITTSDDAFIGAPLEFIAPLEHDQLSLYQLPGGGRVRNFIFYARSEARGTFPARDAMVFLSLMKDSNIEARIIAGSGDETRGDLYGLFVLAPSE